MVGTVLVGTLGSRRRGGGRGGRGVRRGEERGGGPRGARGGGLRQRGGDGGCDRGR